LVLIWYVVGKSVNYIRKGESSMNQKLKQAGLFAILAVFTISMTTSFVGDAEATAEKGKRSSLPIAEPVEPSIKAQQKANAEVETKPEAPRSESNQKRPAGESVETSIKAQQRANAQPESATETSPWLQQIAVHEPTTKAGKDFTVTGDVTSFAVVYAVLNPANIDLRNVEILVTSDTESVRGEMSGNNNKDQRSISVMIDAVDPASVNAKIIGY